jgi:hypothetical protein
MVPVVSTERGCVGLKTVTRRSVRVGLGAVLVAAWAGSGSLPVTAQIRDDRPSAETAGLSVAELEARGYVCESSDDGGTPGAKGCFKDRGDEWYACDTHKGGSGTANVFAVETAGDLPAEIGIEIGTEEDNATDGTKVLGDCDEGPEVNIDNGNYIRLRICIERDNSIKWSTCDKLIHPE